MKPEVILLNKKAACEILFGSANANRYKQLRALAEAGEIKLIQDKWVPQSEIRRLAGEPDG